MSNASINLKLDSCPFEKSVVFSIADTIEYMANGAFIKSILSKPTGNISVMSFDIGEGLREKTSPYDNFVQIIDGQVEFVIDAISFFLKAGDGIVVPAHTASFTKPNCRFKMILTVIKSGYK